MKKRIFIVVGVILSVSLASCAPSTGPQENVTAFLAAAQRFDLPEMASFVQNGDKLLTMQSTAEGWFSVFSEAAGQMTFEITGSKIEKDRASVEVQCSFLDSTPLVEAAVMEFYETAIAKSTNGAPLSEAESNTLLTELMEKHLRLTELSTISRTVSVPCIRTADGAWLIEEVSGDLGNVATANLISAIEGINRIFTEAEARAAVGKG